MAELRVRAPALADLGEIEAYSHDRFGVVVGEAYMLGLSQAFDRIAEYPESAPLRPEYGADIRCKRFRSHRVIYLIASDSVEVLRVLHVSRDARPELSA